MRFGGFPGGQQKINNEEVIRAAINFAKTNKKTFKKYFPTNKVIFEDDADYASDHPLQNDLNFQKFVAYV